MGIKERRDREQQEVKQAILAAARDIAAQEGWQAVTIRKVLSSILVFYFRKGRSSAIIAQAIWAPRREML